MDRTEVDRTLPGRVQLLCVFVLISFFTVTQLWWGLRHRTPSGNAETPSTNVSKKKWQTRLAQVFYVSMLYVSDVLQQQSNQRLHHHTSWPSWKLTLTLSWAPTRTQKSHVEIWCKAISVWWTSHRWRPKGDWKEIQYIDVLKLCLNVWNHG